MTVRCLLHFCLLFALAGTDDSISPDDRNLVVVQKQGGGAVYVPTEYVKDRQVEIRLSDSLTLVLEITGGPDLEVATLDSPLTFEGWNTRHVGNPEKRRIREGPAAETAVRIEMVLDPKRAGELKVALPALRLRQSGQEDAWQTITWQPITVQVVTSVLQTDLEELRDVAPPEDVPSGHEPMSRWLWIALPLGLLVFMAGGLWAKRLLRRPPKNLPPQEWALQELDQVDLPELLSAGQEERLGTIVSDVLRRYLDLRFQWGASSLTTPEFAAGQVSEKPLSIDQQKMIRQVLDQCDLHKFARQPLTAEEGQLLLDQARSLVQETSQPPLNPRP